MLLLWFLMLLLYCLFVVAMLLRCYFYVTTMFSLYKLFMLHLLYLYMRNNKNTYFATLNIHLDTLLQWWLQVVTLLVGTHVRMYVCWYVHMYVCWYSTHTYSYIFNENEHLMPQCVAYPGHFLCIAQLYTLTIWCLLKPTVVIWTMRYKSRVPFIAWK